MTGEKKEEKGTCKYPMHDGKPCGRELYDDERCIFHSKDIEVKKADFEDAFWKEFERQKEQEKEYDFNGFLFPGDISFEDRKFEKDVSFWKAQFSGRADFWRAQFSEEANFRKAQFSGEAYFGGAQFSEVAYFLGAQFSEEAFFGGAQFYGVADFKEAQFSGWANFGNAEFHNKSFFTNVKFEDFNQCYMPDTSFYNISGLLEYLADNRKEIKHPRGIKYLHEMCKPILGEATVSRLPILSREIKDDIYLMSFKDKHPKLNFLWWLFADCGRSFLRWALWSIFFALYFAGNFYLIDYSFTGAFSFNTAIQSSSIVSFIYYSVVTFTTLGFGDITPAIEVAQWWVVGEVVMGYLMLGGLISILANKLARRS